jgi:predicted RNA-binding protein with PUA-like domain
MATKKSLKKSVSAKTNKKAVSKKAPAKKATKAKRPAKAAKTKKAPAKVAVLKSALPPRAPGEKRYWLVKSEPEVFSFDDLMQAPKRTTFWDGIRNYTARNYLRDYMKVGDGVLVYHSNAEPPAIVGIAEVAREGYPDHTQFDASHHHFDPDAKEENPTWYMVDIRGMQPLARPVPRPELRELKELAGMMLLQKGSRLSVQPVSEADWNFVLKLGGVS